MADYGLRVYDSSSVVTLDTTDGISRLVNRWNADRGVSGNSGNIATISGVDTVEFSVCLDENEGTPHYVYRTGDTIYWTAKGWDSTGGSPGSSLNGSFGSCKSTIVCFAYT